MTNIFFNPSPYIHLCVDFQVNYLRRLPFEHRQQLERDVADFSDALRSQIPNVWIAFGKEFEFYSYSLTDQTKTARQLLISRNGLASANIKSGDGIFIKSDVGAFSHTSTMPSELALQLQRRHPDSKVLILTGMNTGACVAYTIMGALVENYDCIAINDLLADVEHPNVDAQWHVNFLRRRVEQALKAHYPNRQDLIDTLDKRLSSMSSRAFLDLQKDALARPIKAAPGLTLETKEFT